MIENETRRNQRLGVFSALFISNLSRAVTLNDTHMKQLKNFRNQLSDFVRPQNLMYVTKRFDDLMSMNSDPKLISEGLSSIVNYILGVENNISLPTQNNLQLQNQSVLEDSSQASDNLSPESYSSRSTLDYPSPLQRNSSASALQTLPEEQKNEEPLFNVAHTRKDGSTISISPSTKIDIPIAGITPYCITQTFPFLKNCFVKSIIFSPLDVQEFLQGKHSSLDNLINYFFSPQKIYKALTEHAGFIFEESLQNNPKIKKTIFEIEKQCRLAWVKDLHFLDGELRYILPISIFHTPDGTIGQHECSLNLDTNLTSQYIFTNIDYRKLYRDESYKHYILDLIYQSNRTAPEYSRMLNLGIIQPSCFNGILGTSEYHRISSPLLDSVIDKYIDYVTTRQNTTPDAPPPPSGDGR